MGRKPNPKLRRVALWLLERLDQPRLVREIRAEARELGFSTQLDRGAQLLPLVRQVRAQRGPWSWSLPEPAEQVRVRFQNPDGTAPREGWLAFGVSRPFFEAGLLSYAVTGRLQIRRPAGSEGDLVEAEEIERLAYRTLAAEIREVKSEVQALREKWAELREALAAEGLAEDWTRWNEATRCLLALLEHYLAHAPNESTKADRARPALRDTLAALEEYRVSYRRALEDGFARMKTAIATSEPEKQ